MRRKKCKSIKTQACPDYIHMLVSIPSYLSVAQFIGFDDLDRYANLRCRYGRRNFWVRGYFVNTVGRNEKVIKECIKNQLEEDDVADQILLEYTDLFAGGKGE